MNESKSVLQFKGYKIINFQFSMNPKAIQNNNRDVGIGFAYSKNKTDATHFTVLLSCFVNDKNSLPIKEPDEILPFKLVVSIEGSFVLSTPGESYLPNAVAILFPYLRSFISTVTAQSGMPPFILPTFNILSLLKNNIAQENKQNDNEKKDSKKKAK